MKRGLIFPGGGMAQRDMMVVAKEAEAAGFDSLYVTEAWRSAFVPLTALALATGRTKSLIRLLLPEHLKNAGGG